MPVISAEFPRNEAARLDSLRDLHVLDTLPEPVFDDIVRLASLICGTPIGLVSLVDADRLWFKARVGLAAQEAHRELAFCAHAIVSTEPVFVVPDAIEDPRFVGNPLVTGEPHIRFYAGAPIVMPGGQALGTVCVVDTVPRTLDASQLQALQALSRQTTALLELRQRTLQAERHSTEVERARSLLNRTGALARVGGWELDVLTGEIDWTDEVYRIHELDLATELRLLATIDFYAPAARPLIAAAVEAAMRDGTPYDLELAFTTASGRALTVRTQGEAVMHEGKAVRLFGTFQDITERKAVEQATLDSQRRLRTLADNLPARIALVDNEQRYRFLNAHIGRVSKIDPSAALGLTMREVRGEAVYALLEPHVRAALRGEARTFSYAEAVDGRSVHYQSNYVPDIDAAGQVNGFYAMTFDITELKETQALLELLARVDTLTGLPNRRQFDERLADAMRRARRTQDNLALMFLDVDHFKAVNDSFGHAAGDEVLREFAHRLKATVRTTDTVARLGGDEFVILLEGVADAAELGRLGDKVVTCIRSPFEVFGTVLDLTTSVGMARCEDRTQAASELLSRADGALYQAKKQGRDQFVLA
jgi:diguanylate cyclase (GGDEF)-like protein/PAS domain S-box-containing protein